MAAVPKYRPVRKPQAHTPAPPGALGLEAFANLAHEMRTPIQVLLGFVDMLRDEDDEGARCEILDRMNRNVQGLADTVENLLDFSRDAADYASAAEENVGVAELLEEIAPTIEAANRGKELDIAIELDAAPPVIRVRRRALRSILANLASNAIKFTDSGSASIRIARAQVHGRDALRLTVKDSGHGMPAHAIQAAFAPMVQLSGANTREHRGLGLGLALVRRNVRMLGGWIHVDSEPGQGSLVTVVIPCDIPEGF